MECFNPTGFYVNVKTIFFAIIPLTFIYKHHLLPPVHIIIILYSMPMPASLETESMAQ